MKEIDIFIPVTDEETQEEVYKSTIDNEANRDFLDSMGAISDFSVRTFVSRSNGKNRRPRKKPREITMITYRDTTYYSENGGEIKARSQRSIGLDVLAMEVLEDTGVEPTVENLIEKVKCYDEIKQRVARYNRL